MPFKKVIVKQALTKMIDELTDIRDNHDVFPELVSIPVNDEDGNPGLIIQTRLKAYEGEDLGDIYEG